MTDAAERASDVAAHAGSGATGSTRAARWRWLPPVLRIAAITAATAAMTFAAVACSNPSPSAPGSGSSSGTTAKLLAYAQCMRSHGIKDFPDPTNGGLTVNIPGTGSDLNPTNPANQAAKQACRSLLPSGYQQSTVTTQDLVAGDKLAACMRSHGYPGFPEPTSQNVFDIPGSINTGLPAYQSAFNTCQSQAHDNDARFSQAAANGQG
jgi:hypothetical protein